MPPAVAVNPAGGSKNGLHKAGSIHVDQERDVLISSDKSTKKSCRSSSGFFQLFRYANKFDYFLMFFGVLFSAVYGSMPALNTIAFRGLTNTLMVAQAQYNQKNQIDLDWFTSELLKYIAFYAVVAAVSIVSGYFSMHCLFMLCERQIFEIRKRSFKSILEQQIEFFDQNEVGKLTQKISSGIDKIRDGSTDKLVIVISSTFSLLSGLTAAFYMSFGMGLVLSCIVPLIILNLFCSAYLVRAPIQKESEAYGRAGSLTENVLSRIRTVLAFCGQTAELNRYNAHLAEAHKHGLKKVFFNSFFTGTYQALLFGSMSVAFWHGTNLLISGKIGPGDVIASFWAALGGAIRVGQSIPHIVVIMGARVAISEVFSLIDQKSTQTQNAKNGRLTPKINGRIEFSGVSFSYPSRPAAKALSNLSFVAEAGKTLALVGRSGSGKTSIVNLLMKHYEPSDGSIKIDDVPLDQLDTDFFRQNSIAIVPQSPVIFSATVEQNLRLGRSISDEDMIQACKLANIHEVIKKLPLGYKTPIQNGRLSGGESQRLTTARALMTSPQILIFDESLSYLDPHSAQQFQSALEKISVGRTIISITHRLPVKNADKILVIDQGKLVEQGTHDELMQQNGIYQHLVKIYKKQHKEDESKTDRQRLLSQQSRLSAQSYSCSQSLLPDVESDEEETEIDGKIPEKKKASILRILRFARNEYKFLIPGLLTTLLRGCSWPIFSIVYGRLFKSLSDVLIDKSGVMTVERFAEFIVLGLVAGTLTFSSGFLLGTSGEKLTKRMRYLLFGKFLSMDGAFFDDPKNSVGKLTTRLSSDTQSVAGAIDQRLADVLQGIVALVIGSIIAFYFDSKMAFLGSITPFCVVAAQIRLTNALKRQIRKDAESAEEASRITSETIAQIRTVHSMNAQGFFYNLYCETAEKLYTKSRKRAKIQGTSYGLMGCYFSLNFGIAYFAGLFLICRGYSTPFSVFQAIESTNMGAFSVIMVATFMTDYLRARVSAALIFRLLDEQPKVDSSQSAEGLKPEISGNIKLTNVAFAYPQNPNLALKDLSFEVKSGQTLALVGPSGGGKSTTVELLERFYDVVLGSIEIDGVDIRQINIQHLRRQMALVPQQPTLFNLTVAENIAYGRPNASKTEIIEAAKKAGAHEFIQALPNDYDTVFGKDGALSGGQIQRISIARAFLLRSQILVLDEINSSVDVENEQIIQEALENETKERERTCIVISHRLNTVKNVDVIAVIDDGKVLEVGSHEELLKLGGLYAKLSFKSDENVD